MVYALLPYSKTFFCVDDSDNGGFADIVPSVLPEQTVCKK